MTPMQQSQRSHFDVFKETLASLRARDLHVATPAYRSHPAGVHRLASSRHPGGHRDDRGRSSALAPRGTDAGQHGRRRYVRVHRALGEAGQARRPRRPAIGGGVRRHDHEPGWNLRASPAARGAEPRRVAVAGGRRALGGMVVGPTRHVTHCALRSRACGRAATTSTRSWRLGRKAASGADAELLRIAQSSWPTGTPSCHARRERRQQLSQRRRGRPLGVDARVVQAERRRRRQDALYVDRGRRSGLDSVELKKDLPHHQALLEQKGDVVQRPGR